MLALLNDGMKFSILARMERPTPTRHRRFGRRALITATAGAALATDSRVPHGRTRRPSASATCAGRSRGQTISLLDKPPPDDGLAGAKLAINDNNTTGRFIGQQFELDRSRRCAPDDDPAAALTALVERGITLVLTDVPADRLLRLAAAGRDKQVTLFNIGAAGRCAAAAGLSRQRDPCRAVARACWPTRWRSTWCGRNGRAGCWPMARIPRTRCWRTRIAARPSASVRAS